MDTDIDLNLKELVGEKALEAYDTYVKLSEYSLLFSNAQKDMVICDNYNLRNYSYPMGIVCK